MYYRFEMDHGRDPFSKLELLSTILNALHYFLNNDAMV